MKPNKANKTHPKQKYHEYRQGLSRRKRLLIRQRVVLSWSRVEDFPRAVHIFAPVLLCWPCKILVSSQILEQPS